MFRIVAILCLAANLVIGLPGCGPSTQSNLPVSSVPPASENASSVATERAATESASTDSASTGPDLSASASDRASGREENASEHPVTAPANREPTRSAGIATTQVKPDKRAAPQPKPSSVSVSPTAEQLEKWKRPQLPLFQLLACYDDFKDSFLTCLATTPDGEQFAVGGSRLTLWSAKESEPSVDLLAKATGKIERPIRSLAISPDGKLLAAGDQGGMLRIWNLSDRGAVVSKQAHDARLVQLAFSPNSKLLATTSYSAEVKIWNVADGSQVTSLKMGRYELTRLLFVTDNRLAGIGSESSIWNIETGKQESTLWSGRVSGSGMAMSPDRNWLAYSGQETPLQFWNVQEEKTSDLKLDGHSGGIELVDFSRDGKWVATYANDRTIRIWDFLTGGCQQVIEADGSATVGLRWLPHDLLLVASDRGRIRIWGTRESGELASLQPIDLPVVPQIDPTSRAPASFPQLKQVIEIGSFPKLPGAVANWSQDYRTQYTVKCSLEEAQLFYRHHLKVAGWTENEEGAAAIPGTGMEFSKNGCRLWVALSRENSSAGTGSADVQVMLQFAGNYDARWLPKPSASESAQFLSSFVYLMYPAKSDVTDLEVEFLKQLHAAGWTPYSRLGSATAESPDQRRMDFIQRGYELMVSFGPPADNPNILHVQTGLSINRKAVPVPPDAGWIEFDSSTELRLVATTKMGLDATCEYYDTAMPAEGWLSRSRVVRQEEGLAWISYIRGQQDVVIGLAKLPDGKTRIMVGEVDRLSWQLQKPPAVDPEVVKVGIEAANFVVPKDARDLKFLVDEKQIQFLMPEVSPITFVDSQAERLATLNWTREKSGVSSDEYVLATFTQSKGEISVRARKQDGNATAVIIDGKGLLWTKPLPTPPVRISYGTWLRRNRHIATLDRLGEFAREMHSLLTPAEKPE